MTAVAYQQQAAAHYLLAQACIAHADTAPTRIVRISWLAEARMHQGRAAYLSRCAREAVA